MKPYYQDDMVTIYNADCREVLAELPDNSIDLVLTDPPYGVNKQYGESYRDNGDNEYWQLMRAWFTEAKRVSPVVVFTPGVVNLNPWVSIEHPFWTAAWYKPNQCSFTRMGGASVWEPILIYGKPRGKVSRDAWNISIGYQRSVGKGHPVPKPEKLYSKLVAEFSQPGDAILDPFLGSGTTAWCAKKLGRKCIGIELEERYAELAAHRCSQTILGLVMDSTKLCYVCDQPISGKRADSDYCSDKCRQRAYRNRRNANVTDKQAVTA